MIGILPHSSICLVNLIIVLPIWCLLKDGSALGQNILHIVHTHRAVSGKSLNVYFSYFVPDVARLHSAIICSMRNSEIGRDIH